MENVSAIPNELDESESVTAKVLSYKKRIEEALNPVVTTMTISSPPPSVITETTTPQPKAKLSLPRFKVM